MTRKTRNLRGPALALIILTAALGTLMMAGAVLGDNAMHVRRVAPSRPSEPDEPSIRSLTARAHDGVQLFGRFVKPERRAKSRCAILLHGIGDSGANGHGLSRMLADGGFATLRTDSRAHGQSGGALATYGILERRDVAAWLDLLSGMDECRAGIYAYGASMGAGVLLQSLPGEKRLKAVVAESPFSSFAEVARHRIRSFFASPRFAGELIAPPVVFGGILYARMRYEVDLGDAAPVESVAGVMTPILLIHGAQDRNIPVEQSREIASRNPAIRLWVVQGAGHTEAFSKAPEEFRQRVFEWFNNH